jgi:hypothetical protein
MRRAHVGLLAGVARRGVTPSGVWRFELILDGKARRVDLAPFAAGRLRTLDPARLRGP